MKHAFNTLAGKGFLIYNYEVTSRSDIFSLISCFVLINGGRLMLKHANIIFTNIDTQLLYPKWCGILV